jgi:hypothetical protein
MTDDKFGVTDNGSAKSFKFNPFGDEDHDEQQSGFSAEERDLALLGAVGSSKTDDIDTGWTSIAEPNMLSESPASLNMTGGGSGSNIPAAGTVSRWHSVPQWMFRCKWHNWCWMWRLRIRGSHHRLRYPV